MGVRAGRRGPRQLLISSLGAALLCSLALSTSAEATSADRSATHTLLQATYTLDLTLVQNTAETNAAVGRAGAVLAGECPKVLAGAPGAEDNSAPTGSTKAPSPRASGEADRHQREYSTLTGELETALRSAAFEVDAPALAGFEATVTPLRWSNPAIAAAVRSEIGFVDAIFGPRTAPAVCADMRAWVASGYRSLSPGSRAYLAQQEQLVESLPKLAGSAEALVKPYEGPAERAILRRREALPMQDILELGGPATAKLREELGIETTVGGESNSGALEKSKVIGRGVTHTGRHFEVEVSKGYGPRCRHIVAFSVTLPSEGGTLTSASSSGLRCLSGGRAAPHAGVACEEGLIKIESSTLAQTRKVRLTLSDGRSITSTVTAVPRRYGGPAGAYFQTLRGPAPYPVSLSELSAGSVVLRTVHLPAVRGCSRNASREKPVFKVIFTGADPDGRSISIVAQSDRERGHRTFSLEAEGPPFVNQVLEPQQSETLEQKPFSTQLSLICEPHPIDLIYGRLAGSGDTVLAATAGSPLKALDTLPIPSSLHTQGVLAYAVLEGLATEVLVRDPAGATVFREDLTARAKSDGEYCEGYAEPGS